MHKLFQFSKIVAHRQRSWQCSTLEGLPRRCTRPLQPGNINFFSQQDFSWDDMSRPQVEVTKLLTSIGLPLSLHSAASQGDKSSIHQALQSKINKTLNNYRCDGHVEKWNCRLFSNLTSTWMFPLILFVFPHNNLDPACNGRGKIYLAEKTFGKFSDNFF